MRSRTTGGLGASTSAENLPSSATPAEIRISLTGLEHEEPADRVDRLVEVLGELRGSRLTVAQRYDTLRFCLRFASQLRASLTEKLVGLSLPPLSEQISLSRKCADAFRLMSDGFRSIAEETAAQDRGSLSDANRLSNSCYWGINCLGDYIVIRCECYLKASPGVWLDIHKLYDLAVSEGVERLRLGGMPRQVGTVDRAYKRMLLLGLSDPFQHSFRGLSRLYDQLHDWASLTRLVRDPKPDTRCVFVVDPRLDRAATPALSQTELRSEYDQVWFVTKELVTRLKQEYDHTISRSADQFHRHEPSADDLDSIEFLRRMIVRWGIHPVRSGARRKTRERCQLVTGLKPVCAALNGFKALALDNPAPGTGTHGRGDAAPAVDARIHDGWEIEDESERGMKLVCRSSDAYGIGVDDVVAVKASHAPVWSVGTVHWAQADESGHVALGLRLIRQAVRPIVLDQLHGRTRRARSEALLLVERSDDGLKRSLICPTASYYPTGTYLVQLPADGRRFVVKATHLLSSSRSFAWFEVVKPEASTTRRLLDLIQPG